VKQRARDRAKLLELHKQEELQRQQEIEQAKKKEEERKGRRESLFAIPFADRVKLTPLKSKMTAMLLKANHRVPGRNVPSSHVISWDNSPHAKSWSERSQIALAATTVASHLPTAADSRISAASPARLPALFDPRMGAQHVRETETRTVTQKKMPKESVSTTGERHDNLMVHGRPVEHRRARSIRHLGERSDMKQDQALRPRTESTVRAREQARKMEQTCAVYTSHKPKRTRLQALDKSEAPTLPASLDPMKAGVLWTNRLKTPELPLGAL